MIFQKWKKQRWYYQTNGGLTVGPFSREDIDDRFAKGYLQSTTRLRCEGEKVWISKAKFDNPDFDDSAGIEAAGHLAEVARNLPPVVATTESAEPILPPETLDVRLLFIADDGNMHGPLSVSQLERLYTARLISQSTKVRAPGTIQWNNWIEQRTKLANREFPSSPTDWFYATDGKVFGPCDAMTIERIWSSTYPGGKLLIYREAIAPNWFELQYPAFLNNDFSTARATVPSQGALQTKLSFRPSDNAMVVLGLVAIGLIVVAITALAFSGFDPRLALEQHQVFRTLGSEQMRLRRAQTLIERKQYLEALKILEPMTKTNAIANFLAGSIHFNGQGVPRDMMKARPYLERAAQLGVKDALAPAGRTYLSSQANQEDLKKAVHYFKQAAEQDQVEGMYLYGFHLLEGIGIDQNYPEAFRQLQKAADRGHFSARSILTRLRAGQPLPINRASPSAAAGSQVAASLDSKTMENLAFAYLNGEGKSRNVSMAKQWMEKAAATGSTLAITTLGMWHYEGELGQRDYVAARKYFLESFQRQNRLAAAYLGRIYLNGEGIAKDQALGMAYLRQGALMNSPDAMYWLALEYESGVAEARNPAMGMKCASEAARLGMQPAAALVQKLSRSMSGQDVAAARKLERCV